MTSDELWNSGRASLRAADLLSTAAPCLLCCKTLWGKKQPVKRRTFGPAVRVTPAPVRGYVSSAISGTARSPPNRYFTPGLGTKLR